MVCEPLTNDARKLRDATIAAFAILFPRLDYEHEEREEFPNYQKARQVAAAILGLKAHDHNRVFVMSDEQIAFEVGYALNHGAKHAQPGPPHHDPRINAVMARLQGIRFERHVDRTKTGIPFASIGLAPRSQP